MKTITLKVEDKDKEFLQAFAKSCNVSLKTFIMVSSLKMARTLIEHGSEKDNENNYT